MSMIRNALCALGLALAAFPAAAQAQMMFDQPAAFQTTRADEALSAPERGSLPLAEIPAGVGPIEGAEAWNFGESSESFVRIVLGEANAWLPREALERVDVPMVGDTALPIGLSCGGT